MEVLNALNTAEINKDLDLSDEDKIDIGSSLENIDSNLSDIAQSNSAFDNIAADEDNLKDRGVSLIKEELDEDVSKDNLTISMQPLLKTEVTDYDKDKGSFTFDISGWYNIVAHGSNIDAVDIKTEGEGKNAVIIQNNIPMTVNSAIELSLPLTEAMKKAFGAGKDSIYVRHEKASDKVYYYPAKLLNDALSFTSKHGLSPFTVDINANPVFEIDGTGYDSLKDALYAVKDGGSSISGVTKIANTAVSLNSYKPTREGYTFEGWYSDKELTNAVTSITMTGNTTVYAKWTENGSSGNNENNGNTDNNSNVSPAEFTDVDDSFYYAEPIYWGLKRA